MFSNVFNTFDGFECFCRYKTPARNYKSSAGNFLKNAFNLFHANVPMWEHNINIGLKFLHKQINSKGTLFLQLL